jgi:hypothetical protein
MDTATPPPLPEDKPKKGRRRRSLRSYKNDVAPMELQWIAKAVVAKGLLVGVMIWVQVGQLQRHDNIPASPTTPAFISCSRASSAVSCPIGKGASGSAVVGAVQ